MQFSLVAALVCGVGLAGAFVPQQGKQQAFVTRTAPVAFSTAEAPVMNRAKTKAPVFDEGA
jgi:hypothetical protein